MLHIFAVPHVVRRGCKTCSTFEQHHQDFLIEISSSFCTLMIWKASQLLHVHHTADQLMHSVLRHQVLNFPCLPPWTHTAAQMHWIPCAWDVRLICRCSADVFWTASNPEWLLHLICCAFSSTGQMAKIWQFHQKRGCTQGNLGHKCSTFREGTEEVICSQLCHSTSECAWIQTTAIEVIQTPASQHIQSRYFCLWISKHLFLCSKTDVTSKIWASLFVFLNVHRNKYTT